MMARKSHQHGPAMQLLNPPAASKPRYSEELLEIPDAACVQPTTTQTGISRKNSALGNDSSRNPRRVCDSGIAQTTTDDEPDFACTSKQVSNRMTARDLNSN